jgi:aspartate/methionine/tyrosine aminotransferase
VLVTPNNPTGAVYPAEIIAQFYDLARRRGLALVLDETYRDFLPDDGPPHGVFGEGDWRDHLVQLYSFSKVYCLTGYRVGSIIAGPALSAEVAMDTIAICAPRLGQLAALYGLQHLGAWRHKNTALMRARLQALRVGLARNDLGYRLISAGAYFAYLAHPFEGRPASAIARRLADEENVLALPGSMFGPDQDRYLRLAFANAETKSMADLAMRLAANATRG